MRASPDPISTPASAFATRALLCLGLGFAAITGPLAAVAAGAPAVLGKADQAFVARATADSTQQITMAKVALDKSHSGKVRELADRIVHDHTALIAEFTDFAADKKARRDTHQAPVHAMNANKARLQQLDGQALDRAFAGMVIKDDQQILPAYEHAAKSSHNPALRKIAAKGVPALREQLKAARAIDRP